MNGKTEMGIPSIRMKGREKRKKKKKKKKKKKERERNLKGSEKEEYGSIM